MKFLIKLSCLSWLFLFAGCSSPSNLAKPGTQLEEELYQLFPTGTSFQDAQAIAKRQRYDRIRINSATGFLKQVGSQKNQEIGESSISFSLGEYREKFLISTSVDANLGFDSNGRLIEIWVRKTRNAP